MNEPVGARRWAIAEGYIPAESTGDSRELMSHEAICILNTGDAPAHVHIRTYFEDREPVGPYRFEIGARRVLHVRMNDLDDPEPVPVGTPYASLIESDVPIVVQHTRLDSRQAALALLSTVGYAAG